MSCFLVPPGWERSIWPNPYATKPAASVMPFTKAAKPFRLLLASRADHLWEKRMKKYLSPEILVIYDFGISALTATQAEDFYYIVTERNLKSSVVLAFNRPPPKTGFHCSQTR